MPKNIIGFNSEDEFDRMSRSVRKSENTPQVGQQQRAKYPLGGGGIKVERAIITEVGSSGVHKAFLVTGGYTNDLTAPDIVSNEGTTEVYTGDNIIRSIEAGDNIMIAKVSGKWWIVEVSEDCRGGCVDEPDPAGLPGYIARYKWHMPYIPCCPEASGTWVLDSVSAAVDTTWESDTFECNSDGTSRKWVYDGTKVQIEPIPDEGGIQYRHEEGNKLCPTKMYAYSYPGTFPEDCGDFPRVACMVPMCSGQAAVSMCGGSVKRNWVVTYSGSGPSGNETACGKFVSGSIYSVIFDQDPGSLVSEALPLRPESGGTGDILTYPLLRIGTDPTSTTTNYFFAANNVEYRVRDGEPFNCDGLNIMDLHSNTSTTCTGFPDTIYVFPADDEYITSKCCPLSGRPLWSGNPPGTDYLSYFKCKNLPYILEVEFTSVANDVCSSCDDFNLKQKVYLYATNIVGGAYWRSYPGSGESETTCPGAATTFYIYVAVGPSNGLLRVSSTPTGSSGTKWAEYTFDGTDISGWSCKGNNTYTLDTETTDCNFPASVTVKPCGT